MFILTFLVVFRAFKNSIEQRRSLGKFTELCGWYCVTCTHGITDLQTLLEVCRSYAGPHDIVYNTTKTVCICWPGQNNHRVGSQQESRSEMRNLALSRNFVTYIGHFMTADCRDDKDIEKQFRRQNSVGNMLVRKSHLHPLRQKSNCSSHIATSLWICSLASFIPELY